MNQSAVFDVVIIGSGAAGMAAALTARKEGLEPLILEKTGTVGGSTAVSVGSVWIPGNRQMNVLGYSDSTAAGATYLRDTVGRLLDEELMRVYLEAGPSVIDFLEHETSVRFYSTDFPDYMPERPGGTNAGRMLTPCEFDGRQLGRHFAALRDPLPEFTPFGGMMVNFADLGHLTKMTRSAASLRHVIRLLARHALDRLRHHRGTRLTLGNALAARLFESVLQARIALWRNAPARSLIGEGGRVTGVIVERDGATKAVRARRAVMIASGGFAHHAAMRERLFPAPTGPWSMAPKGNAGEGIEMALAAGAVLKADSAHSAFWSPVSHFRRTNGEEALWLHAVFDRPKPGLIAINAKGTRFTNEADSYHEFVKSMFAANGTGAGYPTYLIADASFLKRYGFGPVAPGGLGKRRLVREGSLIEAGTLAELAGKLNVPADSFAQTVAGYNQSAAAGEDRQFGKGSTWYNRYLGDPEVRPNPCLATLAKPPFYAISVLPGDIGTSRGIVVDRHARALDAAGHPIPGLYAVGNDMNSIMAGEYPGPGITLGPALVFGFLAARHVAGTLDSFEARIPEGDRLVACHGGT